MRCLQRQVLALSVCFLISCGKDGPAGAPGASGSPGSDGQKGGSSLVAVYDAANQKIGWVMSEGINGYLPVLLTNGYFVRLFVFSGNIYLDRGINIGSAHFASADCSGEPRLYENNEIAHIESGRRAGVYDKLVKSTGDNLGSFSFNSYYSFQGSSIYLTCSRSISSWPQSWAVSPMVAFTLPISLRAE